MDGGGFISIDTYFQPHALADVNQQLQAVGLLVFALRSKTYQAAGGLKLEFLFYLMCWQGLSHKKPLALL